MARASGNGIEALARAMGDRFLWYGEAATINEQSKGARTCDGKRAGECVMVAAVVRALATSMATARRPLLTSRPSSARGVLASNRLIVQVSASA